MWDDVTQRSWRVDRNEIVFHKGETVRVLELIDYHPGGWESSQLGTFPLAWEPELCTR